MNQKVVAITGALTIRDRLDLYQPNIDPLSTSYRRGASGLFAAGMADEGESRSWAIYSTFS